MSCIVPNDYLPGNNLLVAINYSQATMNDNAQVGMNVSNSHEVEI